ncbi:MAG: heat-inducible transcription repressor HrcA [Firmicutes bacterium]|nr:heat-inducible transcription repressor HrcA [Bacillota bacterium]
MDERKKQILHALIRDYVDVGEPVGSRTIAKKYDLGVSPATIRNEMSDLEEMGFIRQPHASAGRIPSDKGYRYYVDHLMEPEEKLLSEAEQQKVSDFFNNCAAEMEQLFQQSCRLLSSMTNYTAMMIKPRLSDSVLERFKLVRLNHNQLLAIMITNDGKIHNKILHVAAGLTDGKLAELEAVLQQRLLGLSLAQVTDSVVSELARHLLEQQNLLRQTLDLLQELLFDYKNEEHNSKPLIQGMLNLLKQPEFHNVDTVRELFSVLETDDVVKELLAVAPDKQRGTVVYIGDELSPQGMSACSMVTTPYYVNGEKVGSIGVLGPTRMPYPKVIALVEQISSEVTNKMGGQAENAK